MESSGEGTSGSSPPVQTLAVKVKCGVCWTETEPLYRGDWLCKNHAPEQRTCKYSTEGCTYSDVDTKCVKHEMYYCQYNTLCNISSEYITGTTLDVHYTQAHGDITHRAGTVCTIRRDASHTRLILECDFGRVVCVYTLTLFDYDFEMWVHTPLSRAQLYKYRCAVDLSHPDTGHTLTCTPAVFYSNWGTGPCLFHGLTLTIMSMITR